MANNGAVVNVTAASWKAVLRTLCVTGDVVTRLPQESWLPVLTGKLRESKTAFERLVHQGALYLAQCAVHGSVPKLSFTDVRTINFVRKGLDAQRDAVTRRVLAVVAYDLDETTDDHLDAFASIMLRIVSDRTSGRALLEHFIQASEDPAQTEEQRAHNELCVSIVAAMVSTPVRAAATMEQVRRRMSIRTASPRAAAVSWPAEGDLSQVDPGYREALRATLRFASQLPSAPKVQTASEMLRLFTDTARRMRAEARSEAKPEQ
jgi:hypothetical protein